MNYLHQYTLGQSFSVEGKGLHSGRRSTMTVEPAPADTGIVFYRTDLGASVKALAENVSNTQRSTTISEGEASVMTIEHIMSALTGMGVDNARISIDNIEVPILDGSASVYVEAIRKAGLVEQDAPRHFIELKEEISIRDEKTGSYIRIIPSDRPEYDLTADFNSRILGVQKAHWDPDTDYASQIGPCRTFVFFHEIEFLARNGLVKGGDVDNAIVIVENPVTDEQVSSLCDLLGMQKLDVTSDGYLSNIRLHFPDECGRHKLLDMIGDLRLCGGWLNARVEAFKPGHTINTHIAKEVRKHLTNK